MLRVKNRLISAALLTITLFSPLWLSANDITENAGIAVGVSAGNMWLVPVKAISVFWGVTAGALSFVLTAGDTEVTRQAWENATQGPYLITPETARQAIGERPELLKPGESF